MKPCKGKSKRKPPGKLPLFPSPYPGESFYSILCRYHLRSGNINDWHTIIQLFGYNTSLASTLLSPFHLEMAKHWLTPDNGVNVDTILFGHTAFPLYVLTAWEYGRSRILSMLSGEIEPTSQPHWVQRQLVHPSGFLRYCPECAAEQEKIFGEAYWQTLPQLDGVEYCPVHKSRIRNSHILVKDIQRRFYPASEALKKPGVSVVSPWEVMYNDEKDLFLGLAQGMSWLHDNGKEYIGVRKLYNAYNAVTKEKPTSWPSISLWTIRERLRPYSHMDSLFDYIIHKKASSSWCDRLYLGALPLCIHVLLMVILCGTPKAFYTS